MTNFKKDQQVRFGRNNGQQTLGVIVKVNRTTVKVRQLEARGVHKNHPIGSVWKVPKSLCTPVEVVESAKAVTPKPAIKSTRVVKSRKDVALESQERLVQACTLKTVPGYLKDAARYLDGHSLDRFGREVDSRRQKLYDAERFVDKGDSFKTIAQCQRYIDRLTSLQWFVRRFGKMNVKVEATQGFRKSYCRGKGDGALIRILPVHQNQRVLIHELTHALVPAPHAGHGRLFCRIYAELVRFELGEAAYKDLIAEYRKQNVKYTPHRELQVK